MISKKIKIGSMALFSFAIVVSYQNCGKIQPGLNVMQSDLAQQESTRAIVQDGDGNIDTVITIDQPVVDNNPTPEPVVSNTDQPKDPSDVVTEVFPDVKNDTVDPVPVVTDQPEQDTNVDSNVDCSELAKKYKNDAIDIANIDQRGRLTVLRGKTFIYSSNSNISLKDVEIGSSCGRTILCGVHIERIKVKKGRLDMVRSTCGTIEDSNGTVKVDRSHSK